MLRLVRYHEQQPETQSPGGRLNCRAFQHHPAPPSLPPPGAFHPLQTAHGHSCSPCHTRTDSSVVSRASTSNSISGIFPDTFHIIFPCRV